MQSHISPNLMKKQTHPNLGWTEGERIKFLGELILKNDHIEMSVCLKQEQISVNGIRRKTRLFV